MQPRPAPRRRWRPLIDRRPRASRRLRKSTHEFQRPSGREPPMAKARSIIKRRQAIQNIRKITRTMELIADLGETASTVTHPLLERRDPVKRGLLVMLTSNRGLAGGYNGNVLRLAFRSYQDLQTEG